MVRLSLAALLFAIPCYAADPPEDFAGIQSKAKPMPTGMTMVDQGKFDPRLKGYITPDGFKLEIVADESVTINPVGMTFDANGTCYVLEWRPDVTDRWNEYPEEFTYKDGTKRKVATMKKTVKDAVKILTRDAKTGQFTKSEVIIEDELPSSILVHDGWIYLSGRGTVRRYKQSKQGGPYDVKEIIAQGFCGYHHHQVSGLTMGPDGWLYITSGDDDNYIEGSDGSRVTVLRSGVIVRCLPDGSKMEEYSRGYRNPYRDVAFDKNGNIFHVDNDNEDGSKFTGCRLMHVAEGTDFGWRLLPGARCCRPDFIRGAVGGELPGKVPPMLKTGRGSPAGLLIYEDMQLPEYYRGKLYYPDVFRKLIRGYEVAPKDSTFTVTHEFELLKSDDPLFRPCQMVTGPDGAIYIVDWRTDSGGAGRLFGDGKHGRIYRMSWAGGKVPGSQSIAAINTDPINWHKVLTDPDVSYDSLFEGAREGSSLKPLVQAAYLRKITSDKSHVLGYLKKDFNPDSEQDISVRLTCLATLQQLWDEEVRKFFLASLNDKEPSVRRSVTDAIGRNCKKFDQEALTALATLMTDNDPSVRRVAVLALGRIGDAGTADLLVNVLKADTGEDLYFSDALLRGFERLGKPGMDKLVDLANSGNNLWRDRAIFAVMGMRTKEAAATLPLFLENPHITAEQRAGLIQSYTNYQFDPPLSLDPLVEFLSKRTGEPLEVLSAAVGVLTESGQIKSDKAIALVFQLLDEKDEAARAAAVKAIETGRIVKAIPKLLSLLADKSHSVDERIALLKTIRVLNDKSAASALKAMLSGEEPTVLRAEILRALTAIDGAAAREVAGKLLDGGDIALQREAVQILGELPEEAKKIGERFAAKKLPRDLLPQVSEALRKHTAKHPELMPLLTEVMRGGLSISLDGAQVEKLRREIQTLGDPKRGKAIFMNTAVVTCMNCHKMEGLGGNVGPDLTRLWDTMSIEKILESIVEPSKEIKEGYQSFKVLTKAGRTAIGLKILDKPNEVSLRDANGQDLHFNRDDIEEIAASKVSLMPDNVVAQLSYPQMLDLVSFLKSREMQVSLRGYVTDFQIVGPFPNNVQDAYGPEKNFEPTATFPVEGSKQPLKWQPRSTKPNGYLDFREVFDRDRTSAYALTYVYAPKEQKATVRLGADTFYRLWVNGAMVREFSTPGRPALPEQDSLLIDLKAGWNAVLVKAISRGKEHGLFLKVEGDGLKFGAIGK